MSMQQVFFDTTAVCIADIVMANGRGKWTGKTLDELAVTRPVESITWEEAATRVDAHATRKPAQVTEERFFEMLNVLPPMQWKGTAQGFSESFRVPEALSGSVYMAFVRIGERYFELAQPISVTHDQLVELVVADFGTGI